MDGNDFDLPRWSSQVEPLSSSGQAAAAAYYAPRLQQQDAPMARSASLGGSSSSARRRHHNQDELDGAYYNEQGYYNDPYYKREPPRSPLRTPNALLDPYQQQAQYSPTTPSYPYTHGPPPAAHARSLSKQESQLYPPYPAATPPIYYNDQPPMPVDQPPKRHRASGFRRVRTAHDLQPRIDGPIPGRRMGADGVYLSPLRQLTTNLLDTYHICNPQFRYESTHNPRRVLTKPSKPAHNEGYDNDDFDYILYVNDWLGQEDGHKYLILDILGQGTFGQVVKCQNMKTHELVAVKVVKNKPAYFNQSMMEVTILEMLNKNSDPNDQHHILRLRDSFIHRSHMCLVFELLSSNLYELIKQNQFQGLSTQLVKVFMAQLLDAMTILKDARLIHGDLKPENILLKSLQSPQIKVIDFGSACHERQTVYTYLQSRFYRSPEVLLGMAYTAAIDMWSLGCIAVELFLGLPLFPGTSEYNQLTRIVEMLGMPPLSMLNTGKQSAQFFDSYEVFNPQLGANEKKYRLKSLEQYSREHNTNEQPGKQYFKSNSFPEIINSAPMPQSKGARQGHEVEKELNNRASFIDFCQGLLNLSPVTRWTPQQARLHPFITGEKFTKPFQPDGLTQQQSSGSGSGGASGGNADPKRPYGGLVPSQPKGQRAYQDAAAYNHHLAQHQAYTAQTQAQAQAQAAGAFRNPYITGTQGSQQGSQSAQQQQSPASAYSATTPGSAYPPAGGAYPATAPPTYPAVDASAYPPPGQQYLSQPQQPPPPPAVHRTLSHQSSAGHLGAGSAYASSGTSTSSSSAAHLVPSTSYYPNARARANTINQMDPVPPALARLQHMNQDVIAGRNALTPVLNRDDAMREWERRQAGGKPSVPAQPYPQLEYLQQQAEMAAASGQTSWGGGGAGGARYQPPATSKLAHSYHPQTLMGGDDDQTSAAAASARRDVVMSNVRSAAAGGGVISSPAQAYASNSGTTGNRYAATYSQQPQQQQQQQQPSSASSFDGRADIGGLFAPMQPEQYQSSYGGSNASGPPPLSGGAARHVAPPAQTVPPSFYGSGVVPAGPPPGRNPFSQPEQQPKDARRGSNGMDAWPR